MTLDDVLDSIRDREGTVYAEPPAIDQPTGPYGITVPVLSSARGHACTRDDLRELTVDEARDICRNRMLAEIRQHGFDRIGDDNLRAQMLDYAWNSGTSRAVRWLQRTVGLTSGFVTGAIDDRTLAALARLPARLVNNAMAAQRAHAAYHGGTDQKFAAGVARRAIEFVNMPPLDEGV